MTAKIFSKDLRLAAHPMMYVFALFGVMLIIPNYPYTVVFFYGLLGIFFTFLNGRENKDVYYCAVLPVTKRDQVRARAWLVVAVELAELVIAIPFAFLSVRINPNGTNLAGIDANVALFGCVLLIYGVFNVVFLPVFYKTAIRAGRAFLLAVIPMTVLMVLVEALSHFPVVGRIWMRPTRPVRCGSCRCWPWGWRRLRCCRGWRTGRRPKTTSGSICDGDLPEREKYVILKSSSHELLSIFVREGSA